VNYRVKGLKYKISYLIDIISYQNYEFHQIIHILQHFVIYKLRTPKSLVVFAQLVVKKLSALYETQMFVTEFKITRDLCLSLAC
jgi:hypothetical protein